MMNNYSYLVLKSNQVVQSNLVGKFGPGMLKKIFFVFLHEKPLISQITPNSRH